MTESKDFEIDVPLYYAVGNKLTDDQISRVQHAMTITPIVGVIIVDAQDAEVAIKFSTTIHKVLSVNEAHNTARRISSEAGCPVLVISGDLFLAYYSDGNSSPINISNAFDHGNEASEART